MIDWAEIVVEAQQDSGPPCTVIVILPPVVKGVGNRKWFATLFDDKETRK